MDQVINQLASINLLTQIGLTLFLLITMVLISRAVVAGTKYSSILIIVVFGLAMGLILEQSGAAEPGLASFPLIGLMSKVTVTVLIASFFVGGQELKKLFSKQDYTMPDIVEESDEEVVLGTKRTQFVYILRSFFILLGIEGIKRLVLGVSDEDPLANSYLIFAYIGVVGAVILIDYKAKITSKQVYLRKGLAELVLILAILIASTYIAIWIKPVIGLPQIFFAMLMSAGLGALLPKWKFGPTFRALLFAGIPVVLAANFLIGGSRILEAFGLEGMKAVMSYGFFGQVFWMFGGIALLIFFGKANKIGNIAPGMAGALSHSGLTGACTAGDLGKTAATRAPIMINVPFFGHVFVFSILAASASRGELYYFWVGLIMVIGIGLTAFSMRTLSRANGDDTQEVKGLMQYAFGWQLTAVFGSFLMLSVAGMSLGNASMAVSSSLSHFGLFAAVQGGMFGESSADLIAFIFAMPFLVHPLVFGMFGKAASNEGKMPIKIVYALCAIGLVGVIFSLMLI